MINGIVAIDKNFGIGYNYSMPWPKLTNDLKFFKNQTYDQIVIMGRKTWNSIGNKPLSNRLNFILSNQTNIDHNYVFNDPIYLLEYCYKKHPGKEIYIIGGSQIYNLFMPNIEKFFITEIDNTYTCDTFFNFDYVKTKFKKIKNLHQYTEPVTYNINEYSL